MGRFVIGLLVGAAAGAAVVYFAAPRSGNMQRKQLKSLWDGAVEAARDANSMRTQELWAEYHARIGGKN